MTDKRSIEAATSTLTTDRPQRMTSIATEFRRMQLLAYLRHHQGEYTTNYLASHTGLYNNTNRPAQRAYIDLQALAADVKSVPGRGNQRLWSAS